MSLAAPAFVAGFDDVAVVGQAGLIADKAFDANWIIKELDERGAKVCVSQMPGRT